MADEVYQTNVYNESAQFVSAKKVALDMGLRRLQLVSFHSTSKGLMGECGRRGGYMELHHIDPYVQSQVCDTYDKAQVRIPWLCRELIFFSDGIFNNTAL